MVTVRVMVQTRYSLSPINTTRGDFMGRNFSLPMLICMKGFKYRTSIKLHC